MGGNARNGRGGIVAVHVVQRGMRWPCDISAPSPFLFYFCATVFLTHNNSSHRALRRLGTGESFFLLFG